jgi:tetratricopeptide (TPR) repeat protein
MNADEFVDAFNSSKDLLELEALAEVGRELVEKFEGHEKGKVLGTLGNIYYALHKLEDAEKAYLEALNLYIKLAEEDESFLPYVVGCLYNLGNLYQVSRKYAEAEKAYTDALKLLGDVKNDQRLAIATALGTMYAKLDLREHAEKYLVEAYEMAKEKRDRRLIGMLLNNLAVVYQRSGKKREAEMLLKMALNALEEVGEDLSIAAVLQNLLPFLDEKDLERVMERLDRFEELPIDLKAKISYFKAKKAESNGIEKAAKHYMDAACLAFMAYRNFGFQSINFMHCLDKVIESNTELSEDATVLKKLILKYYYGSQKVEIDFDTRVGRMIKAVLEGDDIYEDGILEDTVRLIAEDLLKSGSKL